MSGTTDRAHLLNDAFALAESGHVDYSVPLSMTRYLRREADFVPWRAAYRELDALFWVLYYPLVYITS